MSRSCLNWTRAAAAVALCVVVACSDSPPAPLSADTARDAGSGTSLDRQTRGPQVPFAKLKLFFEFNSTDNDLGLQLLLDAVDWEFVEGSDPRGKQIVDIETGGRLRQLGLTELFFESAEPSPEEVLALLPAGIYTFSGKTVDGERLAGSATLSHSLPAAPQFSPSAGETVDMNNVVITWKPIAGLASFQIIVVDEALGMEIVVDVASTVTSLHVPPTFLRPNTEYKAEVLSIATNGNKTITEGTFRTKP